MASNKSKTPGPIQVVVVLMLTVLAFYFGNRFGQVFDFNTMEITDGALATVNSIVAAPAAISMASVALLGFDETKNYGVSFCKNFLATCLAGVIILFAMGLFPNLLSGFSGGEISGFKGDMWSSVCASVALMLIVIKSGTIARDVFGG